MTQDGEGDDAGKEAGGGVDEARDDGVLDAVMVELVVGSECGQGACPDAVYARLQGEVSIRIISIKRPYSSKQS